MKKLGIVILNYLNFNDTIECVESLDKQKNKNFEVVIVDNFSQNSSYETLKDRYNQVENIYIMKTKKNLGYAKGNNAGIQFCKEQLGIQNVLIVNNDVVFTDENYVDFLLNYDIDKTIGAVGTTITGSDGLNQNPNYTPTTKKRLIKDVIYFSLEKWGILKYYTNLKGKTKNNSVTGETQKTDYKKEELPTNKKYFLHGSAIFLTENYLSQVDGFYPETFLYYEENILAILMDKLQLKMVYTNKANIFHKEDQSSAMSFGNNDTVFKQYLIESIKIAIKVKFSSLSKIKKIMNSKGV